MFSREVKIKNRPLVRVWTSARIDFFFVKNKNMLSLLYALDKQHETDNSKTGRPYLPTFDCKLKYTTH